MLRSAEDLLGPAVIKAIAGDVALQLSSGIALALGASERWATQTVMLLNLALGKRGNVRKCGHWCRQ